MLLIAVILPLYNKELMKTRIFREMLFLELLNIVFSSKTLRIVKKHNVSLYYFLVL
jgi:hypothetical protein